MAYFGIYGKSKATHSYIYDILTNTNSEPQSCKNYIVSVGCVTDLYKISISL